MNSPYQPYRNTLRAMIGMEREDPEQEPDDGFGREKCAKCKRWFYPEDLENEKCERCEKYERTN